MYGEDEENGIPNPGYTSYDGGAMQMGKVGPVVQQPGVYTPTNVVLVPDHMGRAIFVTICCCLPLGICAIIKASDARKALRNNDVHTALERSRQSKQLSCIGIGVGLAFIVIAIIIIVILFVLVLDIF